jgi:hypothetical protein
MAGEDLAIKVDGLAAMRRGLIGIDKALGPEIRDVVKSGAQIVAQQAGRNAPVGTEPLRKGRRLRLHEAYKATTSGAKGIVRNPLPHAPIYEYRKSGTPAQMRGVRPVERAIESRGEEVAHQLANGLDDLFRRHGWT